LLRQDKAKIDTIVFRQYLVEAKYKNIAGAMNTYRLCQEEYCKASNTPEWKWKGQEAFELKKLLEDFSSLFSDKSKRCPSKY
jgi:hypothetical protein